MKKTIRTLAIIWALVVFAPLSATATMVGFHLPETPNLQIVRYRPLFTLSVDPYMDMDLYVWSPVALYENRLISILFQEDPQKAFEPEINLRPFYAFAEEIVPPEFNADLTNTIVTDQKLGRPNFKTNVFVYYFSQYAPLYKPFYKDPTLETDFEWRYQKDPTKFTVFNGVPAGIPVPAVDNPRMKLHVLEEYQEEKPFKTQTNQGYLIFLGVVALFFLRRFRKVFMVATAGMAIWVIFYIFSNI